MLPLLFALSLLILRVTANTYVSSIGRNIEITTVLTNKAKSNYVYLVSPQGIATCIISNNTVILGNRSKVVGAKVTITLFNLTEETAGEYWWNDGALGGKYRVDEAFTLYILDKPTIIQNETAVLNRPLVLECQPNAKPSLDTNDTRLDTFWTRNGNPLMKNVEVQGSLLNIKRFKWKKRSSFVCVTMVNGVNSTASETLSMEPERGPDESVLVPFNSNYTKVERDPLRVTCSPDCVPECTVNWTREGVVVSNTSLLDIGHLERVDAGNYTCVVTNKHGRKALHVLIRVEYGPSHIQLNGPSSPPLLNSPLTLACTADCEPACDVTWSKNGQQKARGQDLAIANAQKDDTGTYTCSVENLHGRQNKSLELVVSFPPKVTSLTTPRKSIPGGSDVSLRCTVDSSPPPNITWSKDHETINWDPDVAANNTLYTASLLVRDAQCENTGRYSCAAANPHGTLSSSVFINVTCPPSSLSTATNPIRYQRRHSFEIYNLDIKGNPEPWVVNWTQTTDQGTVVSLRDDRNYEEDVEVETRPFYRLKLIHIDLKYDSSGQYVVRLDNGVGTYNIEYYLLVQDTPGRPANVTILNTTESTITLAFQKGFHGNSEQYFQVVVYGNPPQNLSVVCDDDDGDDGSDDSASGDTEGYSDAEVFCTGELTELEPGTRYLIKVQAVNQIGPSEFSHVVSADTIAVQGRSKLSRALTLLCIVMAVIVVCALLGLSIYLLTCRPCKRRNIEIGTEGTASETADENQVDLWETVAADQEARFPAIEYGSDQQRMSGYRVSKMCVETVTFTSGSPGENADSGYVNLPFNEPTYTRYVCDGNSGFKY